MLLATIDKGTRQLATVTLVWMGIIAGSIFLYLFNPSGPSNQVFFLVCPFRALTGFTCPGCGSTRALHQLLHGNLFAALQLNPLLIVSLPLLLFVLLRYTNAVMRGQPMTTNTLHQRYIWTVFGIVLFFWIVRNTPFYPFSS